MSKHPAPFLVPPRELPQSRIINEKITKLAAVEPYGDLYGAFALSAQIAAEAIEAAKELHQMPGIDRHAFDSALNFWHRTQECNRMAALDCADGNQSLAEALVTFRLFENIDVSVWTGPASRPIECAQDCHSDEHEYGGIAW